MTDLNFDYAAARDFGYSDTEILNGLKQHGKLSFDLEAARKKGHDDSEILQRLMGGARRAAADVPKEEETSLARRAGDVGISALKGIISVPEAIVGLADIPTGGAAGRAAEALGVKFKESKELLTDRYSDAQKAANQRVADASGFVDTAGAMLLNPSTLVQTGVESLPSMVAGGAIGRGIMALAPRVGAVAAGAIGEGAVGAGQAAEQVRQQTVDGSLSAGQAGAALASGVGTGIFGLVGGRIAQKLGIADIDTALVQAGASTTSKGVVRRMIEGGISEGVFEELPQSVQEQMWQNVAMDRPILEGVPESAAQGMLAGGLFGGFAGAVLPGRAPAPQTAPEQQPGPPPLLTNNPEPLISFPDGSVGRQSDIDGFLAGLPEDDRPAARARLYGYEPQQVTPEDVLRAQSVDEAIAVAERALAEDTPTARAQKNAEIDAAWQQYLSGGTAQRAQEFEAAEQARRDADVPLMQEQVADQAVAQAGALTSAQGFDEPQPTAMQLAMQEAQAKRQAVLAGAAQRRAAPPENANATPTIPADAAAPAGPADADAGAPAVGPVPAAQPDAGPAVQAVAAAAPAAGSARPAPAAADEQRARAILTAAGVTGNERMAALRAIRTGENTLEDLIDAHPPKEMPDATPPTTATTVPEGSAAGTAAPVPVQQDTAPARAPAAQLDADAGTAAEPAAADGSGLPAGAGLPDGAAARGAADTDGLTGRAAQRQATIASLGERSTKELRALAKSDKRAYVRTAAAELLQDRDSETRGKRSEAAKKAISKAKKIDPERNTMAEAIASMGGIQRTSAQGRMRLAPEEIRVRAGIRPLFPVNGGMRIEDMAAALAELGYVQRDENGKYDQADFEEKLAEVAAGADVRTPQGAMLRAQEEYEAAQQQVGAETAAEYEQIEYYADNANDELQRMVDAAFDAPPTNKEMTDEEIDAAFGIAPAASRAVPEVDPAAPARESGGRDQAPAGEDFGLTSESADEGRARVTAEEQRQQQAARDERAAAERERQDRDRRDIAARQDASAENFQLGQSAEDSLSGQDALFSKSAKTYTSDELEQMDIDDLDRLAFGHASGDIITINPGDVLLQYDDTENAEYRFEKEGMKWARSVDLSEPVDVEIHEDGKMYLADGHHRRFAAEKTGRKLTARIEIKGNPIRKILKDQEARASSSAAPARGMPAADVTKAITRLRAKWMGFHRINVVQSIDDLPADLVERAAPDGSTEGLYDPRTKSVYLIADNLASPARAAWVAAHEVVGHGGLRMLQDKSVNEALNLAGANKFVKELANAIAQDRTDVAGTVAIEEAISELAAAIETDNMQALAERYRVTVPASAQNGIRGVVARVLEAVRRFLAVMAGQQVVDVSDADVRALIGEQQAVVEGRGKVPELAPDSAPARASVIPANQRTIEVDGERRPITDSTGKLVAQDFQKQQAFYRWFKDSAVVDEQGRPLVVYHATTADFDTFAPASHFGTAKQANAVFDYEQRGREGSQSVMPAYLSIENPKRLNDDTGVEWPAEVAKAKAEGHDGIVYTNWGEFDGDADGNPRDSWIAFKAAQVKSATGNAGTFDPNSDSILQSRAAAAPPAPQNPAGEERIPAWAADLPPEQQAALRKSGAIYTEKTMKQKVKELTDGAIKKMQYGILDQFAPIKDQLGKVPYMKARLAKAADGTLEAMMLYGRPHLDADGGMLVDTTKKGFVETMRQLDGEHDRFFSWLAGRRAEQLKKEGRENLFTDDDISALAKLNQGTMKDGRSREAAYLRAQKDVAELNKSVLDIAEESGLIDAESRKVWASDFYVPFYRVMEEGITGPSIKSGLVNQKSIKKLKGGTNNLGDLTQNMLMNWSTLLTSSAKNRAAKASLDVAAGMGVATEAPEATIKAMAKSAQTRTVSYMEGGTNRWFVVEDDSLLAAISALEFNGYNNNAMRAMSWFKNTLTKLITVSPYFKVRNLIRDSLSIIAVSDADYNVLANWKNGASLLRNKDQMAQMVAGGGIFRFGTHMEGNRGENVKRLIDDGIPDDTVLNTVEKMAKFTRKLYMSYEKVGDFSENLNRAALYKKLREDGKSHLEASFEARDLMDFGLSGAWAGVRALNQILPFFNARLQGLYKLGRGYNDDPKRMGYVIGALALATIALSAAYKDDDDWKKRSDSDRANYWWFKVGGTAYRIPKPFEIGAAATAIDNLFALWYDSENTNSERFAHQMGDLVNGQLAMNPIPQVFRPLIDVYANKDAFSGRPIESLAMQRLRPEDRYSSNTSELARLLSKSGVLVDPVSLVAGTGVKQLSPVQIDSLIKGYFAGAGVLAVSSVDGLLHHTLIDRGAALPVPLRTMTGSFAEELPTSSSRYVDMLYKTAQDVEQTYASYQNAIKQGDIEKARQIMKDEGGTLAKYHMIESLKKNETRIGQSIARIRDSRELTGEQKEEQIRRLKVVQDQIARRLVTGT